MGVWLQVGGLGDVRGASYDSDALRLKRTTASDFKLILGN